jgi:hypothetical protein
MSKNMHDPFADDTDSLDLSAFTAPAPKPADRSAAEAARKAGDAAGFTSRRKPSSPKSTSSSATKGAKVRLSDIVPKTAITGTKSQLNLLAPADLILRFKNLQRELGHQSQWQTLEMAVDALEAQRKGEGGQDD